MEIGRLNSGQGMQDEPIKKPAVTPLRIAKKYNVTTRTVLNWAEGKVIPTEIRVGRIIRFDEDAVDKALKDRSKSHEA